MTATPARFPQLLSQLRKLVPADPRWFQITVLSGLVLYGWLGLGFQLSWLTAAVLVTTALGVQYLGTRWLGSGPFDPRSPLISSLSLLLLLRAPSLGLAAAAAALAIGSKFVLRWRGKHLFNPTNFALVTLLLASLIARRLVPDLPGVWVSPGQWGSTAFFAFLAACLGGLVIHRATRSDVTVAFLGSYLGLLLARAWWLGDPLAIPLHQVQTGSLLIFAFHMISDPKTVPDSRAGRIVFAVIVAVAAAWVQFVLFQPNGPLWALAACAPLVPLLDRLLPASRYRWPGAVAPAPRESPRPAVSLNFAPLLERRPT